MNHSSDALYNAFSTVGRILIENSTPLILIDQGLMEDYSGVHRSGDVLVDKAIIDYLIDMLLDKDNFIRELEPSFPQLWRKHILTITGNRL